MTTNRAVIDNIGKPAAVTITDACVPKIVNKNGKSVGRGESSGALIGDGNRNRSINDKCPRHETKTVMIVIVIGTNGFIIFGFLNARTYCFPVAYVY